MIQEKDELFMQLALNEAAKGLYTTTPNPRVGCVFMRNSELLALGHHVKAGEKHAEIIAMEAAYHRGISLRDSTAYVTLEPCSHHGRTGPCAQTLVETGVKRVVVATLDPNPKVRGEGVHILRKAGITVDVGVLEQKARWLNRGFLSRMERHRPWIRLKVASSADGITALPDGTSQWITGEVARQDGHHLRAQACAILTGIGTIEADNPQLNVRYAHSTRQPLKIILDSHLRVSPQAQCLESGSTWIVHTQAQAPTWAAQHPNHAHLKFKSLPANANASVDLSELMALLADAEINEIHLEAGSTLNGAFLHAGLVDEVVQYIAPRFLGQGKGLFNMPPHPLGQAPNWQLHNHDTVGQDIRLTWIKTPTA